MTLILPISVLFARCHVVAGRYALLRGALRSDNRMVGVSTEITQCLDLYIFFCCRFLMWEINRNSHLQSFRGYCSSARRAQACNGRPNFWPSKNFLKLRCKHASIDNQSAAGKRAAAVTSMVTKIGPCMICLRLHLPLQHYWGATIS